ncbi:MULTISPECIES: cytochrome-c oxidase, cbb3-type subunit III [Aliivibrio]|uniref:Cytochrome c oxidase subunit III n=1 Tax=Aliivibrio logei 5S-186 TaxID=626086 RepID=A0ABX3B0W0_ALILO|nr:MULTISPECIES: cytochrome-c oxidase, cbb3-type subunit III [Aliivibrio]MBB1313625.1 cytochrome-c oxidase, cbb3-type subunit III [Aliivibrio sp. SR45-2]OEF22503.1 cytochrome-c oxidase, cbb3-type subunit III [Aliivibrio logei 5S-186]
MTGFWNIWVITLTVIFLVLMVYVVVKYWRTNHLADKDKTIDSFDDIDENDAPPPRIMFVGYFIAFSCSIVFLVLYPGLGNWQGLLGWEQSDDTIQEHNESLDEQIAGINQVDLTVLAAEPMIVSSGKGLFQTHCAACHRANGQGQKHFPNLIDDVWLYGGSDSDILHSIKKGRYGAMAGWKNILPEEEIQNLSYYLASLQQRPLNAPSLKIKQGETAFMKNCVVCHGGDAKGNQALGAPNLSDNVWLHGGSIEEIQHTINDGLNNIMPAFEAQLSDNEILALAAFITQQRIAYNAKIAAISEKNIKQGEYLAYAGDCVACHSAEGGEPFAGGLPFVTPFGTVYSTNITPHFTEGIGDYSYDDFKAALYDGKGKHGYLYPAMPYTSYQHVTEEDVSILWDYLQSIPAASRRNDDNSMMFPSNIRLGLLGWNIVFMDREPLDLTTNAPVEGTDIWSRGKYLVAGLGHCSECHTPRNIAQALEEDKIFQGNIIDGWNAPDISARELYQDRWDVKTLTDFLHTGHSDKGSAFGGMADVVKNSTSFMTREDVEAMATYLLVGDENNTIPPDTKQLQPTGFTDEAKQSDMYPLFVSTCGACHGEDGKGRDPIAPTLLNNGIIMHRDPYNTIAVTIRGLEPSYLNEERNFMPMVSFQNVLTDAQLSELISFIRDYLGDRTEVVTAADVKAVREKLQKAGYAGNFHTTPDMYDKRDRNINVE